ncbi:hypothetical protein [Streptomyces sp. NBC_00344]|uniref:hypothetical protein n=1 Tax=Streptomyces sp. NBC_00344 TaxID=2975720 RepID=UPI002E1CC210
MHHRVFLTAFALSTAAVLGGTAPTAMAADSPAKEARIGLIADTTAKCLGMSDKAPLKGIPDLTTFTAKDLARLRVPEYAKCAEAVKNDSDNPVNALIEKLKSSDVLNGLAVSSDDLSPQFGLVEGAALNKVCGDLPAKLGLQTVVGLANIALQDIPILSTPHTQQCADNVSAGEDDPLTRILSQIPELSGNDIEDN